jgi:hypothetical protein
VWFRGEVDFSGFPIFADFGQQDRDWAQRGGFVGKEAGDTRVGDMDTQRHVNRSAKRTGQLDISAN